MSMMFREPGEDERPAAPSPRESKGGMEELRAAFPALVAAAKEAIERAISGDNKLFNQSTRQEGGQ